MHLNSPLNQLFSSLVKVKLLRQLTVCEGSELTGRALAREIGVSAAQAHLALRELEAEGVVTLRRVGTAHVYSLDRETMLASELLIPLFGRERSLREVAVKRIIEELGEKATAIFVFGSVARGSEKADSDLDLAFVVETARDKERVLRRLADTVGRRAAALGLRLSPYVVTRAELSRRFRQGDRFVREILTSGLRISGLSPAELINGR